MGSTIVRYHGGEHGGGVQEPAGHRGGEVHRLLPPRTGGQVKPQH